MADWRTCLHFLSRLEYLGADDAGGGAAVGAGQGNPEPNGQLGVSQREILVPCLRQPKDEVIDSLFLFLTKDAHPNIGHIMLAHLAEVLRIRTVLTTNFDSLTEEAFEKVGYPVTQFDVHRHAGLPDPALVLARPSIVKLHGGRYGLRADFSVDAPPTEQDRWAFRSYLLGKIAPHGLSSRNRNHLLVLGMSVRDHRTLALLVDALLMIEGLRVYWVCYQEGDDLALRAALRAEAARQGHPDKDVTKGVITVIRGDLDLVLLELYQMLRHALPPAGTDYLAAWPVPPQPGKVCDPGGLFSREVKAFRDEIDEAFRNPEGKKPRVLVLDGEEGTSSVAAQAFEEICREDDAIWLDMDQFLCVEDMWHHLMDVMARRQGEVTATPLLPALDWKTCRARLRQYVRHTHRERVVIFLNGRDVPGQNAGLLTNPWNPSFVGSFCDALEELRQENVLLVVVWRDDSDAKEEAEGQRELETRRQRLRELENRPRPLKDRWQKERARTHFVSKPVHEPACAQAAKQVMAWLNEGSMERPDLAKKFVYALTLFRQPRHLVALCSWALIDPLIPQRSDGGDNDEDRIVLADKWIDDLWKMGAIRHKSGGFVCMHTDVRIALRDSLEKESRWDLLARSAECHCGIADWYVKLFRSCNDPVAMLESLNHRYECLLAASLDSSPAGETRDLVLTSITEATAGMRLAWPRLLTSGCLHPTPHFIGQFREGLEKWRDRKPWPKPVQEALQTLLDLCGKIEVDFGREAGNYSRAIPPKLEMPVRKGRGSGDPKRRDLAKDRHRLDTSIFHINIHSYETAERLFAAQFQSLGLDLPPEEKTSVTEHVVEAYRAQARRWAANMEATVPNYREIICLGVQSVRWYMDLQMLKAEACGMEARQALAGLNAEDGKAEALHCWRRAEGLYCLGTELLRRVDTLDSFQIENATYRMNLAGVLANLKRYSEAHRRLNEAASCLSAARGGADRYWGTLFLRRAEVYLRSLGTADTGGNSRVAYRLKVVLLDSAQIALEQGRRRMIGGRQKNVLMWTWLHELRVWACLLAHQAKMTAPEPATGEDGPRVPRCGRNEPCADMPQHCRSCGEGVRRREAIYYATDLISTDVLRLTRLVQAFARLSRESLVAKDKEKRARKAARKRLKEVIIAHGKLLTYLQTKDPNLGPYQTFPATKRYVELAWNDICCNPTDPPDPADPADPGDSPCPSIP